MKAPVKHVSSGGREDVGGSVSYDPPDKEWLEYQYVTLGKSAAEIATKVGCGAGSIRRWLRGANIPLRSKTERDERHALRMSGPRNPAWVDGFYAGMGRGLRSRICQRALRRSSRPEVCTWCGVSASVERLEAHHRDHNPENCVLVNLQWLCRDCHKLETHVWRLLKQGKIDLECDGESRTMVIKFKK